MFTVRVVETGHSLTFPETGPFVTKSDFFLLGFQSELTYVSDILILLQDTRLNVVILNKSMIF